MAKGDRNPITESLLDAEEIIDEVEKQLYEEFGLPLYVTDPGKGKGLWQFPDKEPDQLSPEEMQVLINTHGKARVDEWLMDRALTKYLERVDDEEEF